MKTCSIRIWHMISKQLIIVGAIINAVSHSCPINSLFQVVKSNLCTLNTVVESDDIYTITYLYCSWFYTSVFAGGRSSNVAIDHWYIHYISITSPCYVHYIHYIFLYIYIYIHDFGFLFPRHYMYILSLSLWLLLYIFQYISIENNFRSLFPHLSWHR